MFTAIVYGIIGLTTGTIASYIGGACIEGTKNIIRYHSDKKKKKSGREVYIIVTENGEVTGEERIA